MHSIPRSFKYCLTNSNFYILMRTQVNKSLRYNIDHSNFITLDTTMIENATIKTWKRLEFKQMTKIT